MFPSLSVAVFSFHGQFATGLSCTKTLSLLSIRRTLFSSLRERCYLRLESEEEEDLNLSLCGFRERHGGADAQILYSPLPTPLLALYLFP